MYYDKRLKTLFIDALVERGHLLYKGPLYDFFYELC